MQRLLLTTTVMAVMLTVAHPTASFAAPPAEAADRAVSSLSVPAAKAGRARPLVVVVAANPGAETTDFTIPYGVLKDSGVADVLSLSTRTGPVQLMRAVKIQADATLAEFDATQPLGADIVVVPAQMNPKDPVLNAWLRAQADKGAVIMSICEGARVLAHAGLLEGRRAATHWSAIEGLEKHYPRTTWVRDRRYVQDGPIISTTGVSASIPASLALVEAIGGRAAAAATAERLGVASWSADHRTADFGLTKQDVSGAVGSLAAFWSHETVEFPLSAGLDEITLALQTDVWSRTMRSKVVTTGDGREVRSKHGLRIVPDARAKAGSYVVPAGSAPAAANLEAAFEQVGERYGPSVVRLAKIGMEYDAPAQDRLADLIAR